MNTKKVMLLLAACCLAIPSHAQKGKQLVKVFSGSLEKNVLRGVADARPNYHPVFGYTNILSKDLANVFPVTSPNIHQFNFGPNGRLIQTAPILNPVTSPLMYLQAFSHTKDISSPQITEGLYLYRLAHPTHQLTGNEKNIYLANLLETGRAHLAKQPPSILLAEELPAKQLLTRLQKTAFMPNSYAELVRLFPVYPKHITLNEEGIPVKTSQADMASVLDTYLMLSNRKQLGAFNNTKQGANYTPFVLTPEEHAAANELLKSRLQNEQIPANPSANDLIEIAYNRLESHTVPYTQAAEAGAGYKAYPNYKNTALYRTIQGMIKGQAPVVSKHNGIHLLENEDITHLIILDAIMGGVELTDLKHADRTLRAFDEFSAELKNTPQNVAHVQILQQNLRIVFEPYIEYNRNMPYNSIDGEDVLGWHAHELLDMTKARNLVGRNWK